MARYIKEDGNYLLWQSDMLKFGPLTQLSETLTQIGAIALLAHEAKEEQDGTVTRPLPQATDERFVMPTIADEEIPAEEAEAISDGEESAEGDNADTAAEETSGESESKDESETQSEE